MAEIQFDTEQEYASASAPEGPKGFAAFVMKWGLAKDEKTAQYVLLGVIAGAGILAFLVPVLFGSSHAPVPQAQVNAAMQRAP